ncbi:hypothetical protein OHA25_35270 [Nonomuraea sp. NBC_00507]|uniref:hypothetical protein n=1 Tax=Nonomuraea sp. NBC_00507 TaxID=2976002 RepID=UPI002E17FFB5
MISGRCPGYEIDSMIPANLIGAFPLFWYGGAPLIVLAFAGWYASVRTGRDRLGRMVGRVAAVVLLLRHLPRLLLLLVDGAFGPECVAAWGPPELVSLRLGGDLYVLVPVVLILLAVRSPQRAFVRRGRFTRTAATVLTVTATLLVVAQAAPAGNDFHGLGGIEGWQGAPDRVVLTQGHRLCGLATPHGGDVSVQAPVRDAPHGRLGGALGSLCPAVEQ